MRAHCGARISAMRSVGVPEAQRGIFGIRRETLRFRAPERPESGLRPADNRLRLDDHQHLRPPRPHRAEGCPEKPAGIAEGRGLDRAVQHQQLVAQCRFSRTRWRWARNPAVVLLRTAKPSESMAIPPVPIQSTINDFRIGWSFCYPPVGNNVHGNT